MIKVKITKNIIKRSNNTLGIGTKEIITTLIAAAVGVAMYFLLKNVMSMGALLTLIFVVLGTIICFGCVNMQGQSMFELMIKSLKGAEVRPYESKGVFSDYGKSDETADQKRKK